MKFPATQLLLAPASLKYTPLWPLPEMTLRAPGSVPPMMLPGEPMSTPLLALPRPIVPFTSVPMKFPRTTLPVALRPPIHKPVWLPERRLRSTASVPPMRLFRPFKIAMPATAFTSFVVPPGEVPMKQPAITLFCPPWICTPLPLKRLMKSARTVVLLVRRSRPVTEPAPVPTSPTRGKPA